MECLVFVDEITERVAYTFDFIFKSRGLSYELTSDIQTFNDFDGVKLNYSSQQLDGNQVIPSEILFEKEIKSYKLQKAKFNDEFCLSLSGVADPVASVFYTLTRYEEYVTKEKDQHERFPFEESYLKEFSWIEKCMCDRWAVEIIKFLQLENQIPSSKVKLIPTFDIDNTYAYRLKTGKLKFLSICKDLLNFNFERIKERKQVLRGAKDPYDTFDLIREIGIKNKETKLFWLIGERAEKDKNISIENREHQQLIISLDKDFEVNLHPSYNSNGDIQLIDNEKSKLEKLLSRKVIRSRQHFLRFQLPNTYQVLNSIGFKHEYSMGFAEHVGFRSGTAKSHHWFDLTQNKKTDLIVHPFAYMDGTLNEYMQLSIQESKQKIQQLYNEVCEFGGDFIFIWHNETIGDYKKWKGWSEVLRFTLNLKHE